MLSRRPMKGRGIKTFLIGKDELPNSVQKILDVDGNLKVQNIKVCRKPLEPAIDSMIRLVSRGEAQRVAHDTLYHLYAIVSLEDGSKYRLEKNEIIMLKPITSSEITGADCRDVPLSNTMTSLKTLIENAIKMVGSSIFHYNALSNNCQKFITDILNANGFNNPSINSFVNQDVRAIAKTIPKAWSWIGDRLVRLNERLDYLTGEGYGSGLRIVPPISYKPFIYFQMATR